MKLALSLYILITSTSGVITAVLGVISFRQRKPRAFMSFPALLFAVTEWTFFAMLEAASPEPQLKILWSTLEYLGLAASPTLFFIFVLEFNHLERWLTRRSLIFLAIIPVATILVAFTNGWSHWLWSAFAMDSQNGIMIYLHGPWFWVNAIYSYFLLFIATVILIWDAARFLQPYRSQVWALVAGAVVPWVSNIFYVFNVIPDFHLDLTSVGFAATGILFSLSINRFDFMDLVPVARDLILESLGDGIIVLDENDRIVDLNPAARQYLDLSADDALGQAAGTVLASCPGLADAIQGAIERKVEIETGCESKRFLELHISPLLDKQRRIVSKVVLFRDITDRKNADLRLLDTLDFNQKIISTSPVGILVYKASGECILANESSYRILKAGPDDLLRQNFREISTWKKSGLYQMAEASLTSGAIRRGEVHHFSSFGRELWLDVSFTPFSSSGDPHLLFALEDITERKLIEVAEHEQRAMAEALRDTTQALNSSLDLDVILDRVLNNIGRVMAYDSAEVFLLDDTGKVKMTRVIQGTAISASSKENDFEHAALEFESVRLMRLTNRPSIIADVRNDINWVTVPGYEWIRSHISVPLTVKGKTIGALGLNSQIPGFFSEIYVNQIMAFANSAAMAIDNARLYTEVQRLAITDELTGLYNFRALMEMGPREVERAHRFDHNLAALFIDIDNFGNFNKRYSHSVGNLVLQSVAGCLKNHLRAMDLVVRYGGEEFVVLLPETSTDSAVLIAERLRVDIMNNNVSTDQGELAITISIGVAELGDTMPDLTALINLANQAERQAKENGRNQVVMIEDS